MNRKSKRSINRQPINSLLFKAVLFIIAILGVACSKQEAEKERPIQSPNVILIMADDMGYECLGINGSTEYSTPQLDQLAGNGIRFTNCISQPLCTPSRVKIMTGLRNYRNYEYFGFLSDSSYTFGHLMQAAGYKTCITGKWQLNGISYPKIINNWSDMSRPHALGFDEYCLWQLTKSKRHGERYAAPLIVQNGKELPIDSTAYGPDIFVDYLLDFVRRNQDSAFFIYYPMVLVHDPFVSTPHSASWTNTETRFKNDTTYFADMVAYTDYLIGRISSTLDSLDLLNNTLLIFTGDNGTSRSIRTQTASGQVTGGKGKTIQTGIHVPLIVHWPAQIKESSTTTNLVDFSDFFPTLAELSGTTVETDGQSFLPLLTGKTYQPREFAFVHYDPRWGGFVNQYRNQFVMTSQFKLYQDSSFYDFVKDPDEAFPLSVDSLTSNQQAVFELLANELMQVPIRIN